MRTFGKIATIVFLACALLASYVFAACTKNPGLYMLGIVPPAAPTTSGVTPPSCVAISGESCCTAEVSAQLETYMWELGVVTNWLNRVIASLDNLNSGLISNISFVSKIFGMISPLLPSLFGTPCSSAMPSDGCGPSVLSGLLDSTNYPRCMSTFMPALIQNILTNNLNDVRNVLSHLHNEWPLYQNIVSNVTVSLTEYGQAAACAACHPSITAKKAMPVLGLSPYYFEGSATASEPLVKTLEQLAPPLESAIMEILDLAVSALDVTAGQCRLQVENTVKYELDSFFETLTLPIQEIWNVLVYELGVFTPTFLTFLGTMSYPVMTEYGITDSVIQDFETYTGQCAAGILYVVMDAAVHINPDYLGDLLPASISGILGQLEPLLGTIYTMAGNGIDREYCALRLLPKEEQSDEAAPFAVWVGDFAVRLLTSKVSLSKSIPWLKMDPATSQQLAVEAAAAAVGAEVSPWGMHAPLNDPENGAPGGWIPALSLAHRRDATKPFHWPRLVARDPRMPPAKIVGDEVVEPAPEPPLYEAQLVEPTITPEPEPEPKPTLVDELFTDVLGLTIVAIVVVGLGLGLAVAGCVYRGRKNAKKSEAPIM